MSKSSDLVKSQSSAFTRVYTQHAFYFGGYEYASSFPD